MATVPRRKLKDKVPLINLALHPLCLVLCLSCRKNFTFGAETRKEIEPPPQWGGSLLSLARPDPPFLTPLLKPWLDQGIPHGPGNCGRGGYNTHRAHHPEVRIAPDSPVGQRTRLHLQCNPTALNDDMERIADSLTALQTQVTSLAALALQNRRALDLLTAEKGGTCLYLNEECCYFVNQSGIVTSRIKELKDWIQARWRDTSFWGLDPYTWGNLAAPFGGTCMHNPPSSLSCSLSFPMLAGSPTRTCPSVRQSTPPPALLSPAHF
ncbi:uncharacterized protein LOC125097352 [Lutra lutra]|uniref:uncharacterized protein LOC125097352 n=1 Tax=Lutra lutra TaxID=9657 RepID=UPI001FD032EC|nr:uncharacterized protein LOC125097352 [Lutra lutra]